MDTANLNGSVTNINNIRFDETWKGSAAENQVNQLNNFMQDFNKCIQDITAFNVILLLRDQYIKICDRIKELDVLINGCNADHDDPDCSCSCGTYAAEIAKLEKERMALRREYIDSFKASLTGILENTYIQEPDGSKHKLQKKDNDYQLCLLIIGIIVILFIIFTLKPLDIGLFKEP